MIRIVLHPPPKGKFTYDVELDGEMILTGTHDPEYDAARVMRDRGMTGPFQTTDVAGRIRMTFRSIEEAAKWAIQESPTAGPRRVKWVPFSRRERENGVHDAEGPDVATRASDASLEAPPVK